MTTNLQKQFHTSTRQAVVMIVDDEEMVTSSLSAFLEWETDYRILTFQSPAEALESLRDHPVDVVIADFLMPGMNGLLFLTEVKRIYPDVPRILLTGYADKEHAIRAINEIGLYHYFEKPWDNEAIKLAIQNGIENKTVKGLLEEKVHELDHTLLQRDALVEQHETLREELYLAREVQQSMLPNPFPAIKGLSFAARYIPALEIGGDFYDVIPMENDHLGILLADMTGHGIQAALSTALLKFAFSPFAHTKASPQEILSGINTVLCKGLPQNMPVSIFAAAAVVIINTRTAQCRIANGGMPHPVVLKRNACDVTRIPANGMVLGIFDGGLYRPGNEISMQLDDGDMLILYTDGLNEAENINGELFDIGSIRDTLLQDCTPPGEKLIERLIDTVKHFSKPDHRWDDLTLLGVEVGLRG